MYRGGSKMIHKITVKFLLILICFLYPVNGFTFDNTTASFSQSQDSSKLLTKTNLQRIIVFSQDQAPLTGYLAGIKSDTLIIQSSGQTRKVPRSELIKVIIFKNEVDHTALNLGMIMGFYIGNLAMFNAEDQPTAYLISESNSNFESPLILLFNLGFIGLGGFLGHSFYPKLTNEVVLDFTDNEQEDVEIWKRIEKMFYADPDIYRIHFSVYSSHMYDLATAQHISFYRKYTGIYINEEYRYPEPASKFNLLRRIQITMNLEPDLEIGPIIAFLGEPSFEGYGSIGTNGDYTSFNLQQDLHTIGYYFGLIYYPFQSFQNKNKINWNVGLSIGAADLKYALETFTYSAGSYVPEERRRISISKHTFSALISSELYFTKTGTVALGLQADFAFIPQQRIGGVPEIGLPSKKLTFSNGGIGILFKINL